MKTFGPLYLIPIVCLALIATWIGLPACSGQAKSIDNLPEPARQQFRNGLAEYKVLMAQIERRESRKPVAPAVLKRAKRELEQAWLLNDTTAPARVRFRGQFQAQGKEVNQRYLKWFSLTGVIVEEEGLQEVSRDQDFRPLLGQRMFDWFTLMASGSAPRPGEWSVLEPLLPKNINDLTEEKAVEIALEWQKQLADEARKELKTLAPSLDLTEEMKQTARDWNRAQSRVSFYGEIVNDRTKDELTHLKTKADMVAGELTRLWPGWMASESCGQ